MIVKPVSAITGEIKDNKFLFPVRVYYEDTDAGGVVYYANYLKFAERARTEYIRALGVRQQDGLESEDKFAFMVRHCVADYQAPAVLDDELVVSCQVTEIGGATCTMHQEITRGDQLLVSIDVKAVYVSLKARRPVRIPKDLVAKFV
ncbi:MAG: tol-pal system-associated acyl-CoA thioesterase [Alphaproteobacteria bacterium]|nr:tol-pal system-associated acyl-CoA thioesterase [Alphaproteobacteria bacterium]